MLRPSRKQNDLRLTTREQRVSAADSLAGGVAFIVVD